MSPTSGTLLGTVVDGKFQVERLIGEGGMGAVYEARQLSMNRLVALKVIHAHLAGAADSAIRFQREMVAMARVRHPNTVQVFDFGQTESGAMYLAMELLEGRTLSAAIRGDGPFLPDRVVHVGAQIARALSAIHHEGIVHRDLKPANVVLTDRYGEHDIVKVLDFGIARLVGPEDPTDIVHVTATGSVVGTPLYMAPEQIMGKPVDARADLYSLGIVLYEMLSGRVPFYDPTPTAVMMMQVHEAPAPPTLPGGVPAHPALERLILELLAKAPTARPPDAQTVARRLETAWGGRRSELLSEGGGGAGAPPPAGMPEALALTDPSAASPAELYGPAPRRSRVGWWAAGLATLAVAGGVAAVVLTRPPTAAAPEVPPVVAAGKTPDAGRSAPVDDVAPVIDIVVRPAPDAARARSADVPSDAGRADAASSSDGAARAADARSDTRVPADAAADPGALRSRLDAAARSAGEVVPPATCRTNDSALLDVLVTAAEALAGGEVGGGRPGDRAALAALEAAAGRGTASTEYWALVARARLLVGAAGADDAARRAVAACSESAVAQNLLGNALQKSGALADAEAAYTRALGLDATYAAPRFNLALAALARGDARRARGLLDELIARNPDHPHVYLARAHAHLASGEAPAAVADLEEEIRRAPDSARAFLALGHAHRAAGAREKANAAYCRAKELGLSDAEALCTP